MEGGGGGGGGRREEGAILFAIKWRHEYLAWRMEGGDIENDFQNLHLATPYPHLFLSY